MFREVAQWYKTRFADPNLSVLFLLLLTAFFIIYFFGNLLTPVFVAIVLSYLLGWPIKRLMLFGLNRTLSIVMVMAVFLSITTFAVLWILPTVFKQGASLLNDLPIMLNHIQEYLLTLPTQYPQMIDLETVQSVLYSLRSYLLEIGGTVLSQSFASLKNVAALLIYAILVPMMMFFILKDKVQLIKSLTSFLPNNLKLVEQVWIEMNGQIMNYIRGKVLEIVIVGLSTYCVFFVMEMRYSALLALLVGLSVLIPYIGAAVVTVPVALVAMFQWGVGAQFGYLILAYLIVQALDGNLLVPILFSEAVNLHPVIIIMSVLFFGGLWGFWGIFFAIPLATLVKAVLNAWPTRQILLHSDD